MASIFAHAAVAATLGSTLSNRNNHRKILGWGVLCAVIPDLDVIAFKFGIPYEHMLGHRGFTHSIMFAVLISVVLISAVHRKEVAKWALALYYFCCAISHGLLDALTTGGRGVGFFIPFTEERFFFPWRVIKVSPIGASRFFSEWGLQVLINEFFWIGIPCIIFYFIFRKRSVG